MKEIAIIDYGLCNLDSVGRAVEKCGGTPVITDDPEMVTSADGIILPGVGSFNDAMRNLTERGFVAPLRQRVLGEVVPFLGICLGMQLMASLGHEGGKIAGLDLIPGEIVRLIPDAPETRIPHVGWNEVVWAAECLLAEGIPTGTDFYFVHSFHFCCDERYIMSRTPYCGGIVSTVGRDRCFGVQFHPEKSLAMGQRLLRNFIALC
ncbi:MAG: imidazole glycerol phosphate synthase subunit HisH [Desulfobulbaceae bacterium]|nr:imidazole glycerol phosphate synthase subunit HisH [Desulfobulbaceae bacterium]